MNLVYTGKTRAGILKILLSSYNFCIAMEISQAIKRKLININ